jgi:hypothetical protein
VFLHGLLEFVGVSGFINPGPLRQLVFRHVTQLLRLIRDHDHAGTDPSGQILQLPMQDILCRLHYPFIEGRINQLLQLGEIIAVQGRADAQFQNHDFTLCALKELVDLFELEWRRCSSIPCTSWLAKTRIWRAEK